MKISDMIDMVPTPARIIAGLVMVAAILGLLWYVYHRIDQGGYDRRTAEYEAAAAEQQKSARTEILKSEKKYEKIDRKIIAVEGDKNIPAPRVDLAIDSLPSPSAHR